MNTYNKIKIYEKALTQIINGEFRQYMFDVPEHMRGIPTATDIAKQAMDSANTPQHDCDDNDKTYYLVLNEEAGEGVIFTIQADAHYAATGEEPDQKVLPGTSTLADEFRDLYGENDEQYGIFEVPHTFMADVKRMVETLERLGIDPFDGTPTAEEVPAMRIQQLMREIKELNERATIIPPSAPICPHCKLADYPGSHMIGCPKEEMG